MCRANGIQPVFVFSGLSIIRKDKPFSTEDTRPSHRATAWDFYDRGKLDLALSNWASSSGIHSAELLNSVLSILNKHNVEFIRAPYSAWAQVDTAYHLLKSLADSTLFDLIFRFSLHTCTITLSKWSMLYLVVLNY